MTPTLKQLSNWGGWKLAWERCSSLSLLDGDPEAYVYLLGQICHESGTFAYWEEIASGEAYEGRKDLGNTMPGDGKKYKGRGALQLTGRANYATVYKKFLCPMGLSGLDIITYPTLASDPYIGSVVSIGWLAVIKPCALTACMNRDITALTKAINGGTNGLESRKKITEKLLEHWKKTGEINPFC